MVMFREQKDNSFIYYNIVLLFKPKITALKNHISFVDPGIVEVRQADFWEFVVWVFFKQNLPNYMWLNYLRISQFYSGFTKKKKPYKLVSLFLMNVHLPPMRLE